MRLPILAICLSMSAVATSQQIPSRLAMTVDTTQTAPPVSKYQYGMFTEHIRNSLSRSLWAELIDDRKFYYPITSKESVSATTAPGGFRDATPRIWRPIGGDDVVSMDTTKPFVGDQSPRITLDPSTPHGIRQSGFALVKGKKYTGRIVINGTPRAQVKVTLVWGAGESDRQTVPINAGLSTYHTIPINFTAQAASSTGALEITGTGKGDFHIGTVSLMPSDNLSGFRSDSIAALRQVNMGFWRYGGNYTSNLIWYHVVGDPDKRPPEMDHAWNAMQPNDLGLDEFMTLCKLLNVDPYISVNAGFGDSHSAAEEVEYMNGAISTPMGAKRARNGHPQPYHVKFWNIGNEPWGPWQLGRTDTNYYMLKHNEFAKAMREVDPSIILIASGRMLQDDTLRGELRTKNAGNIKPLFGTEADWTGSFLARSWGNFDGIAEHWYAQGGHHFDVEVAKKLVGDTSNDQGYVKVDQTLQEWARYPANIVHMKAEEWQGYQQRFPVMVTKNIFLSFDEYSYQIGGGTRGVNLKLALAYGMVFNEMMRHTDFVTMAAHTTGSALIDYTSTAATLNTTGLVFKLYGDHFPGSIPVAITGNSPQPAPKYPPGADQPITNSGSPTYPLDVVATLTPDGKFLNLAVVNATDSAQMLDVAVPGMRVTGSGKQWQMAAGSLDAANRVGQEPQVQLRETTKEAPSHGIDVAAGTITVYQFPVVKSESR